MWFRYRAVPERRKLLRAGVSALGYTGFRSNGANRSESVRVSMRASVSVTVEGEDRNNEVEGGVFSESGFFSVAVGHRRWYKEVAEAELRGEAGNIR